MARLRDQKKSTNFVDQTGPYQKFVDEQFYRLLMRAGLTYPSDPDYVDHMDDVRSHPPEIKGVGRDPLAAESRTQVWSDMELTPEENQQIKNGATHRDILLYRAYKKIPAMVGK